MNSSDLNDRQNITLLVNLFYEKVKSDELLAPVFAHVDWPRHLPVMYDFWCSMLLGDQSYQGNPFQKHMTLSIGAPHFNRWLALFTETVDENFSGEKAQEVKDRARSIAGIFQHRLGIK